MRIRLSIDITRITQEVVDKYIHWVGDKGFLNLFVGSRKNADQFGNHLYVKIEGYEGHKPDEPLLIGSGRSCRFRMSDKGTLPKKTETLRETPKKKRGRPRKNTQKP